MRNNINAYCKMPLLFYSVCLAVLPFPLQGFRLLEDDGKLTICFNRLYSTFKMGIGSAKD